MEKQIEELHELSESIYMSGCALDWEERNDIAEQLYNAGYRKQSEGEWIIKWKSTIPQYEPSEYQCSNCELTRSVKHKFCPNCGAKMKGGAE